MAFLRVVRSMNFAAGLFAKPVQTITAVLALKNGIAAFKGRLLKVT
jgi:hypothetical protein